jgi:hypothetical protein
MKKGDLKRIIKPLVKECINEVLLEEGVLSNIVSEVARGMANTNMVVESSAPKQEPKRSTPAPTNNAAALEKRKRLMDAIGNDSYNGVNLFENTQPMSGYEAAEAKPGSVDLGDPGDAGVDISSIVGNSGRLWEALK